MPLQVEPIPDAHVPPAARSLLDEIRADYQAAEAAPQHLDLQIPKSKLGIRYKPLGPSELPDVSENVESMRNVDLLLAAHDCVIVQSPHGGWEPLAPEGMPLRLSGELAGLMGWECPTARDVVIKAFSTVPSPMYGVARHAVNYSSWVTGERDAREEAQLGES